MRELLQVMPFKPAQVLFAGLRAQTIQQFLYSRDVTFLQSRLRITEPFRTAGAVPSPSTWSKWFPEPAVPPPSKSRERPVHLPTPARWTQPPRPPETGAWQSPPDKELRQGPTQPRMWLLRA